MNYLRAAVACPKTNVADIAYNLENIKFCINTALKNKSKLIVFPELSVTSYTCADLFEQKLIIDKALEAIEILCTYSRNIDIVIVVGAPFSINNTLFNCAL